MSLRRNCVKTVRVQIAPVYFSSKKKGMYMVARYFFLALRGCIFRKFDK